MDTTYAGWAAAAALAIGAVVKAVIDLSGSRAGRANQVRRDTLDEYKDLLDRQRVELDEVKDELGTMRDHHGACERKLERLSERVGHYERALTRANIPFDPWVDDTGTHPVHPGEGGK